MLNFRNFKELGIFNQQQHQSWVVTSLISGVSASVIFVIASLLPSWWAWGILSTGLLTFVFVLYYNPAYWYRRTAAWVLGFWFSASCIAGISIAIPIGESRFAHFISETVGFGFHISVALIVVALLVLDYLTTRHVINHLQAETEVDAKDLSERFSDNQMFTLVLHHVQSVTGRIAVDTSDLFKKDKAEIAKSQIENDFKIVLAKERRWVLLTITIVVATIAFAGVMLARLNARSIDGTELIENFSELMNDPDALGAKLKSTVRRKAKTAIQLESAKGSVADKIMIQSIETRQELLFEHIESLVNQIEREWTLAPGSLYIRAIEIFIDRGLDEATNFLETYFEQNKFDKRRSIGSSLSNELASKLLLADFYFLQFRFDESIRKLQNLIADNPGFFEARAKLGAFSRYLGEYGEAEKHLEIAKELADNEEDKDFVNNNLGMTYSNLSKWSLAEPLLKANINHAETQFGKSSLEWARALHNYGEVVHRRGDFLKGDLLKAESALLRSLIVKENLLGSSDIGVATTMSSLAGVLKKTNRRHLAGLMHRRALQISLETSNFIPSKISRDLSNLSLVYASENRLSEAVSLVRIALDFELEHFGNSHPNIAIRINNLAGIIRKMGRFKLAAPLFQYALKIDQQNFELNDPKIAQGINNVAFALRDIGELNSAIPLFLHSISIFENNYGSVHPNISHSLHGLASVLGNSENPELAEPFYLRALRIEGRMVEVNNSRVSHEHLAVCLNDLGWLLYKTGRTKEAEKIFVNAIQAFENIFGPRHEFVVSGLCNLAKVVALDKKQNEIAAELFQRGFAMSAESTISNKLKSTQEAHYRTFLIDNLGMSQKDAEQRMKEEINDAADSGFKPYSSRLKTILGVNKSTTQMISELSDRLRERRNLNFDITDLQTPVSDMTLQLLGPVEKNIETSLSDIKSNKFGFLNETSIESIKFALTETFGPVKPLFDVLADLDKTNRTKGVDEIWFDIHRPIALHIDMLIGSNFNNYLQLQKSHGSQ